MYCYTVVVGDYVVDEIEHEMREGVTTPVVYIGEDKGEEIFIPVAKELFEVEVKLDQDALEHELKGSGVLSLATITNGEFVAGGDNGVIVSRPTRESDRRALVLVKPPADDNKVRYSGTYKVQRHAGPKNNRVVRASYSKLDDTIGIEVLGAVNGTVLITMDPGASFRVGRKRGSEDKYHLYQLSDSGYPTVRDVTSRKKNRTAA